MRGVHCLIDMTSALVGDVVDPLDPSTDFDLVLREELQKADKVHTCCLVFLFLSSEMLCG